jgi:hypothetical protein
VRLVLFLFGVACVLAGCEPAPTSISYCSPYHAGKYVFDLEAMQAVGTDVTAPIVARRYDDYVVMSEPEALLLFKGRPAEREFSDVADGIEIKFAVARTGSSNEFVVLTESGSFGTATNNWKRHGVEVYSAQKGVVSFATIQVSPPSDSYEHVWSSSIPCSARAIKYSDFEHLPLSKHDLPGAGAS